MYAYLLALRKTFNCPMFHTICNLTSGMHQNKQNLHSFSKSPSQNDSYTQHMMHNIPLTLNKLSTT